jgi:hypothetical protein
MGPSGVEGHAMLTDPVGDIPVDPRIAKPPDLTSVTVDIADGNLTFFVQFAPGTLDRDPDKLTWLRIDIDTDRNSATGNREQNGMGSDFDLLALANGTLAALQKAQPDACASGLPCSSAAGSVPMIVVGDTFRMTVPLSRINNTDGHLLFLIKTWPVVNGQSLVPGDLLPNLEPGRI